MIRIFAIAAAVLLANSVHAAVYTGADLKMNLDADAQMEAHPRLAKPIEMTAAARALGYITGVTDSLQRTACIPPDVTTRQIMAIVYKYLKATPAVWDRPAYDSVTKAVAEAFPCKKK